MTKGQVANCQIANGQRAKERRTTGQSSSGHMAKGVERASVVDCPSLALRARQRRGFSLLELLLAVAVVVALSASVYSFLFELIGRRARIVEVADSVGGAAAVFDRLQADLTTAVAYAGGIGAGIDGGSDRVRIVSRGVPAVGAVGDAGGGGGTRGDLVVSELEFDAEMGELRGRAWAGLVEGGGEFRVIASGVEAFRLRYHDGRGWRESFDSGNAGRLPAAVEVSTWFGEVERDEEAVEDDELIGIGGVEAEELESALPVEALEPVMEEEERAPDRRRVIVVPDGPDVGWGAVKANSQIANGQRAKGGERASVVDSPSLALRARRCVGGGGWLIARSALRAVRGTGGWGWARLVDRTGWQAASGTGGPDRGKIALRCFHGTLMSSGRRGVVLLTVLLVVTMGALIGTTLILAVDAERAGIEGRLASDQSRAMAWSGVQGVMAELAGQRDELLVGDDPVLTEEWVLIENAGGLGRGVVRLVAFEDGSIVRSEAARLDINAATAEMLGALPGVSATEAEAIVSGRSVGMYASVDELAGVDGAKGLLDSEGEDRAGAGSVDVVSVGVDGGGGRTRDLLTAYAFDPEVTTGVDASGLSSPAGRRVEIGPGTERLVVAGSWSESLQADWEDRYGIVGSMAAELLQDENVEATSRQNVIGAFAGQGESSVDMWGAVLDVLAFSNDPYAIGRVDITRAPAEVLGALPGMNAELAGAMVEARGRLDGEALRDLTWPVTSEAVPAGVFARMADWVTTRSTVWRVRVEAGYEQMTKDQIATGPDGGGGIGGGLPMADEFGVMIEGGRGEAAGFGDDPFGESARSRLRHRVVYEAVIDVSGSRPRVAYLRDVTSLELAERQRAVLAGVAEDGAGFGGLDDAAGEDEEMAGPMTLEDLARSFELGDDGFGLDGEAMEEDDDGLGLGSGRRGRDRADVGRGRGDEGRGRGTRGRSDGGGGGGGGGGGADAGDGVDRRTGRWTGGGDG
jgi:prepilin-type N-terminal cleavage/methylation domain-containing protein